MRLFSKISDNMLNNDNVLSYLHRSNIYEVNIRQYSSEGNIQSFIKHLPRLKKMGIDILWLMPIHPIGLKNRKGTLGSYYSSSDYFDINPEFGTKADFKNLVEESHSLGMKIIIDWVANHAAWDNQWTQTNPDFFERNEHGEFLSPYDWTDVIQINHNNEAAHDALRDAMCFWVKEFDIDGFRADLAHLTPLRYWVKARQLTEAIKPDLIWLAETEDTSYYEAFDISYSWKWMHKTEAFFKNDFSVGELIKTLNETRHHYPHKALQIYFTSNHDENSWNGTEFEKYGIYAKALGVFSYFYPWSVPLIYSGQELPNMKRLSFFDKDCIEWNGTPEYEDFYRLLNEARKNLTETHHIEFIYSDKKLLAFQRGTGHHSILVLLNLDSDTISFSNTGILNGDWENIFNSSIINFNNCQEVALQPGDFLVLKKLDS